LASLNGKIGYSLTVTAILLMIVGTIGISFDDEVNDIPTPNTPRAVYFADEPLQDNPVALLLSAKTTLTWDRSDIYLVIADEDKKSRCDQITPIELISPDSTTCKAEDSGYEAVGLDNSTGLEWTVENGDYYVGIGTLSDSVPEDFELNVAYTVNLNLSATGYFLVLLLGACGITLIKYD
tara:strand:- start:172 stop:711 length:540 start_codon:yes stop_codon:yes gene_type:complete